MADPDRNIWDPPTPEGNIELGEHGRVVDLHIYVLARSRKDDAAVRNDVARAASIWCQENSRINIQAVSSYRFPELPTDLTGVEGQIDINLFDLAERIDNPILPEIRDQFAFLAENTTQNLRTRLAVFYLPGHQFMNGDAGLHAYWWPDPDKSPKHVILLSNQADGRTLAHEIGHALFTMKTPLNTWQNLDPDDEQDPQDPWHNTSPRNLMSPHLPPDPLQPNRQLGTHITDVQAERARMSPLLDENRFLVSGFRTQEWTLAVEFKDITSHGSADGNDDVLESSWTLSASTEDASRSRVRSSLSDTWSQDPLHFWNYKINKTLKPLKIKEESDVLNISVAGIDDDDYPNLDDNLVGINDDWLKSVDTWGSQSSNVPNGLPGDHAVNRSDENISYTLTYNISVLQQPTQTTFRAVCKH